MKGRNREKGQAIKGRDGIGWVIKGQDGMDVKTCERPEFDRTRYDLIF